MQIKIVLDEDNKTLSIIDNGIGMNREDLILHLGTIANSGTENFLQKLEDNKENKCGKQHRKQDIFCCVERTLLCFCLFHSPNYNYITFFVNPILKNNYKNISKISFGL